MAIGGYWPEGWGIPVDSPKRGSHSLDGLRAVAVGNYFRGIYKQTEPLTVLLLRNFILDRRKFVRIAGLRKKEQKYLTARV